MYFLEKVVAHVNRIMQEINVKNLKAHALVNSFIHSNFITMWHTSKQGLCSSSLCEVDSFIAAVKIHINIILISF